MYDKTFQAKVWPVITSILTEYVAPVYDGRLSFNVPISLTDFPNAVYQSADGGGKNDDYINQNGWTGLVTIRSIDVTLSGAWNHLQQAMGVLASGVVHDDYVVSINADRPQTFPIDKITRGTIYTAGVIIAMGIYPKD